MTLPIYELAFNLRNDQGEVDFGNWTSNALNHFESGEFVVFSDEKYGDHVTWIKMDQSTIEGMPLVTEEEAEKGSIRQIDETSIAKLFALAAIFKEMKPQAAHLKLPRIFAVGYYKGDLVGIVQIPNSKAEYWKVVSKSEFIHPAVQGNNFTLLKCFFGLLETLGFDMNSKNKDKNFFCDYHTGDFLVVPDEGLKFFAL